MVAIGYAKSLWYKNTFESNPEKSQVEGGSSECARRSTRARCAVESGGWYVCEKWD